MPQSATVRRFLLSALSGAVCGSFGPAVLFLLLSWYSWRDAVRFVGFFAAASALYGALPGLLNGCLGTLYGLWVERHRITWLEEVLLVIPMGMVVLAWVWDRSNPKVGFTLMWSFVPAGFVLAAGVLGQRVGRGGRNAKAKAVDIPPDHGTQDARMGADVDGDQGRTRTFT